VGRGSVLEGCIARGNGGNGVASPVPTEAISLNGIISEGNALDGFVVGPGSTLTDCQAINNGGNGIHVTDNNVPAKTVTTHLRGCVARSNSNMGFKIVIPPGGAAQEPIPNQRVVTPAAPAASTPLDVEKATAGASLRPARGPSLAMPLASVRFAGTGFGCVAEDNLGDGFYLDGEWSLSQCVSRNNGGVGINSWSFGEAQTSSAEGNASDGFVFHGGYRMTDCTSRGNGGVGINSYSFGIGRGTVAEGNTSDGFVLRGGYVLTECTARGNGGVGLHVTDTNTPARGNGCVAEGNGLDGFIVTSGAMLTGCTAQGNGTTGVGSGIRVTGTGNRLEGNHLLSNYDWGISLFGGGNLVIGNTAADNRVADYDIAAGNSYGPIVSAAAGNLSMANGGDQPTANFSLTCPTWCRDADADTFGDPNATARSCTQPTGYVSDCTDCDDTNAAIRPGATEICNGVDDDCDQTIDEGCPPP
jgi:parallel beta-helix repeat protein